MRMGGTPMTATNWIEDNLQTDGGDVILTHGGEGECGVCGFEHNKITERISIDELTQYVDTSADNVRESAISATKNGTGHARFFK